MLSHLHSSIRQEGAAGTAVYSVLTPSSGFWSFFGLPSAWLCPRAKATQQQHSCLMEPWRPHKASSPAQVMRESFLGLSSQLIHQTPNAVSTAGSGHCTQADLCCVCFQDLALGCCQGWAGKEEHHPHSDQHRWDWQQGPGELLPFTRSFATVPAI